MTRLLVVLRLIDSDNPAQLSDPVKAMLAASAGSSDFETLKTELADAKRIVTEAWLQVLGTRRKGKKMAELKAGSKAPDFALAGGGGRTFRLAASTGRKLVLHFYPQD